MPQPIQSGFAPVSGGSLYYEAVLDGPAVPGDPALLFIHAGVADHSMWDAQFEFFAPQYAVIRYDTRGYGNSRTESVPFAHHQDAAMLLDHLGVERAVLVGCSRGGQIAIDFAVAYPQRCLALVPVSAGVSGYRYTPDDGPKAQIEKEIFNRIDEADSRGDIEALNELEVNLWADGVGQPVGRAAPDVRQRLSRMNLATFNRQDGSPEMQPLDPPAIDRLSTLRVPALVLAGEYDTSAVLKIAGLLAAGIPGARKVIFANAAHMLSMEYPEKFNFLLQDFLRQALK